MQRPSRGDESNGVNSVSGVVRFGEQPVVADVVLEASDGTQVGAVRTDKDGRFTFLDLPLGKYVLKVRGVEQNKTHRAEQEITVLPRPQEPTEVTVELR
jgi:hypothetical protein